MLAGLLQLQMHPAASLGRAGGGYHFLGEISGARLARDGSAIFELLVAPILGNSAVAAMETIYWQCLDTCRQGDEHF